MTATSGCPLSPVVLSQQGRRRRRRRRRRRVGSTSMRWSLVNSLWWITPHLFTLCLTSAAKLRCKDFNIHAQAYSIPFPSCSPSPSPPPLRLFPLYCVPLFCIQIHSTHTHTHTHTAYKHDLNLPFVVSNHLPRSPPPIRSPRTVASVSSQIICHTSSAVLIGMLIIGFIERRNNLSQAYGTKLERSRVFFSATPLLIAGSCSAARTADRPIILVF